MTRWPEGESPPIMSLPLGLTLNEVIHRYTLAMWEANGRRTASVARGLGVATITVRRHLHMYDPDEVRPQQSRLAEPSDRRHERREGHHEGNRKARAPIFVQAITAERRIHSGVKPGEKDGTWETAHCGEIRGHRIAMTEALIPFLCRRCEGEAVAWPDSRPRTVRRDPPPDVVP